MEFPAATNAQVTMPNTHIRNFMQLMDRCVCMGGGGQPNYRCLTRTMLKNTLEMIFRVQGQTRCNESFYNYPEHLRQYMLIAHTCDCEWRGFPCTIFRSGHIEVHSAITALVNSRPLPLCRMAGAPKVQKISINW